MTTKKPHGSGHVRKGVSTPETKALYVELDAADHERFKTMAESIGMTMRDFVRLALESVAMGYENAQALNQPLTPKAAHDEMNARRNALRDAHFTQTIGPIGPDGSLSLPGLLAQAERISRLEAEVARLRDRIDRQWGPESP